MATTATATPSNPADVRAAALAVLKMADDRIEKGATSAKHRSPLPANLKEKRISGASAAGRRSSAASNATSNTSTTPRASFNIFQWGKKQMEEVKDSMNKLDEKFLAMQFEQEEKIRKAYDKTASDLSGKLGSVFQSPPNKKKETVNLAPSAQEQVEEEPIMSRFRTSFQGFTKKLMQPEPQAPPKPPSLDEQIVAELEQLHELMTLCHTLLQEKEETLVNYIDYEPDPRLPYTIKKLEAALPRMDQLMEAGIDGQFAQDDTTQICVSTYERLILTLEKCNSPLVKSNAFAFTKDLEGDSEFDETSTGDAVNTSAISADSTSSAPPKTPENKAAEPSAPAESTTTAAAAPTTATTDNDLTLDGLDADLDIDLAAFEIGDDEEDAILNTSNIEDEKKTDSSTPSSDDDFIKDMFE